MSNKIIDVVKRVKEVHKDYIIMIKVGNFCYSYGRDAYIMSYIFGYKLKKIEENIYNCAFPLHILNRIIAKLENSKLNYIVLDRRNNYETDLKYDNKNLFSFNISISYVISFSISA